PYPPSSTLFPYTTLFRSTPHPFLAYIIFINHFNVIPSCYFLHYAFNTFIIEDKLSIFPGNVLINIGLNYFYFLTLLNYALLPRQDRKSTRLNSSHVKI